MSNKVFAKQAKEVLSLPKASSVVPRRPRQSAEEKTLKILFVGDPHFDEDNSIETKLLQERVVQLIKAEKVDTAILMGDLLDRHGLMHSSAHTRVTEFLSEIHRLTEVVLIIGNHDMRGPKAYMDGVHGFNPFKKWDRFTVVDHSMNFTIGHLRVIGVPYVYKGLFHKALGEQDLDYHKADLILAHQEFEGILGPISDDADEWDTDEPLVVTGHIHDYSWHRPNILYTGAPMMKTYGEKQPKTVSLFVYEGESTLPVEMRYNLDIPPRVTVKITAQEALTWSIPSDVLALPITHRRLKLKITGSTEEIAMLRKSGRILMFEKEGVKVDPKPHIDTPKTAGLSEIEDLRERMRDFTGESTMDASDVSGDKKDAGLFDKTSFYQVCLDRYVRSKDEVAESVYENYKSLVEKTLGV